MRVGSKFLYLPPISGQIPPFSRPVLRKLTEREREGRLNSEIYLYLAIFIRKKG